MKNWYKRKGYIHFDSCPSKDDAEKIVLDPEKVTKHSFYPMLRFNQTFNRIIGKDDSGSLKFKVKELPLTIPAHIDGLIYSYYSNILEEILLLTDLMWLKTSKV